MVLMNVQKLLIYDVFASYIASILIASFRSGVKYILRTDIMYRKSRGEEVDPKEEEALQLVQQAERLEVRNVATVVNY